MSSELDLPLSEPVKRQDEVDTIVRKQEALAAINTRSFSTVPTELANSGTKKCYQLAFYSFVAAIALLVVAIYIPVTFPSAALTYGHWLLLAPGLPFLSGLIFVFGGERYRRQAVAYESTVAISKGMSRAWREEALLKWSESTNRAHEKNIEFLK